MSESGVTRGGIEHPRPGREAPADYTTARQRRRRGAEQPTVPEAEFRSYYGLPVLNKPVWSPVDIAGYLFLGGLAGASSVVGAVADVQGSAGLARVAKTGAASAAVLSLAGLVHDLGRPTKFINMLRVLKPTSPMNMGSWLLSAYAPAAIAAAGAALTGRLRAVGVAGTVAAAALGPAVAAYTAVLISDTAVPAWHDGYREMPFVFVGSAAMAAGGLGLLGAPVSQQSLPRRIALAGAVAEIGVQKLMERRLGMIAKPYSTGRGGRLTKVSQGLAVAGGVASLLGRTRRLPSAAGGGLLLAASACSRFGIFFAGIASAQDPSYTIEPQRHRLRDQAKEAAPDAVDSPVVGSAPRSSRSDGSGDVADLADADG
jgi:hypothetical protein